MSFDLIATDAQSDARAGKLTTAHGEILTPIFMPVGTRASVRAIEQRELHEMGAQIILGNTYHLYLRPSTQILHKAGGLHKFMSWTKPILTDSGGYQVFSLSDLRHIDEQGVVFKSHLDGSKHHFTPESVVDIQRLIGSDVMMVLDECPPHDAPKEYIKQSNDLTIRWAARAQHHAANTTPHYGYDQTLFAITQGGTFDDLRADSTKRLVGMNFDGYAIGGLAVGESEDAMYRMIELSHPLLPQTKPRYLMGVGTPTNILNAIERGVDMFDCVLPTREGRNGRVYTRYGAINIRAAKYADDFRPLDDGFENYVCQQFSRAYIRHLLNVDEIFGLQLCSLQNISFFLWLTREARAQILAGRFKAWKEEFLERYRSGEKLGVI
ncbi:MAG: queuine tRNA-ribosyltransferase [[Candidatus Thermochlorobacteriaceae] bacterium GBChlB]|nr:MAG: queuine tRNA-ribosyltransferase [[Candidatus Thermochlorobacteriaceae] bacterium GBChlB]